MALVVLAENISTQGSTRSAQYLLTSIAQPARAKRGANGDMWLRFFDACDNKPQCIVRVTRVWRSHTTAKELEIGLQCVATRLQMRWRAGRQRLWKSFQARQMLSKRLTAWLGKSESTTRDPIAPVEGYSDVEDPSATVVRWMLRRRRKVTGTNGVVRLARGVPHQQIGPGNWCGASQR